MKSSCYSFEVLNQIISQVMTMVRISDETSPYSNPPLSSIWTKEVRNSRTAIACLLALPFVTKSRSGALTYAIKEHISKMAYNNRYEGKWNVVQEILELNIPNAINPIVEVICKYHSTNEIFGNIVPLVGTMVRSFYFKKNYISVIDDNRPVRRPQRRRGYNDKGSLRLPHEHHSPENLELLESKKPEYREFTQPRSHEWISLKGNEFF